MYVLMHASFERNYLSTRKTTTADLPVRKHVNQDERLNKTKAKFTMGSKFYHVTD